MVRGDGNTEIETSAEQGGIISQKESRNNTFALSKLSRLFVIL